MHQIVLGKNMIGSDESLKFEKYKTKHVFAVGATGSGKSNLLEGMIEQASKIPEEERPNIVFIDDQQEFGRLRNYIPDFIMIGNDGEIPIDVKQARETGRQIRINKLNVIIRISSLFEAEERYEYLEELIKGIIEVEQQYWVPMWFVCDEAQKYASSKERTARQAIANLATTGRKQGIMLVVASLRMTSVYTDVRTQCLNHIIGLMDAEDDRDLACEALRIPKSESKIFDRLEDRQGLFLVRGMDISKNHVMIQAKDMGWKTHEEKYFIYPKLSKKGLGLAEKLRQSLGVVKSDLESTLRNEISRLNIEANRLRENQLDVDTVERIEKQGFLRGWNEKHLDDLHLIAEIQAENKPSFLKKPKVIVVLNEFDRDGKPILRKMENVVN